ncbi:hypothetical protein A4A49_60858, partial [Nicotiana attenuata]
IDLSTNCFFVCRDVVFKEHIFPFAKSFSQAPIAGDNTIPYMSATEPLSGTDLQPERTDINDSGEEVVQPGYHDDLTTTDARRYENEQHSTAVAGSTSTDMPEAEATTSSSDDVRMLASEQQQPTLQDNHTVSSGIEMGNNELRRSKRTAKEPLWLQDYVTTKGNQGS